MARSPLEVVPVLHASRGQLIDANGRPVKQDTRGLARSYKREHDGLYVVDLDGLRKNRPDVALLQTLGSAVPLWADAGARFHQDVMDLIIAGAEQVTLRYQTLRDENALEETVRLTEQVALALEFQDDELVQNKRWPMTPPELVQLASKFHLPLVVIDLSRAGETQGIDRSVAWHGRNHAHGAYFMGGVASDRDLGTLDGLGYAGALVSAELLRDVGGKPWSGRVPEPGAEDEAEGGAL